MFAELCRLLCQRLQKRIVLLAISGQKFIGALGPWGGDPDIHPCTFDRTVNMAARNFLSFRESTFWELGNPALDSWPRVHVHESLLG